MPKFKFSKLVRDKIVDDQVASGAKPSYRVLNADEHKKELIHKILEEAAEIGQASREELAGEIADAQQAIDDLKALHQLTDEDIIKAQAIKNEKKGAFKKGLFIEHLELAEDDPWVEYYRRNAERYPEIE